MWLGSMVLVLAATPASAQDPPDSIPPADTLAQDTVAQDTAARPVPVPPDLPASAPRLALDLFIGTLGLGDLQSQPVRTERLRPDSTITTDTLRRTVAVNGGFQIGASAAWSITPRWAVRVGAAWGQGQLEAGYAGGTEELRARAGELPDDGASDVRLLLLESALRFRLPSQRRVQPYAELGVGASRWSIDDGGGPGPGPFDDVSTRLAVLAGIGGTVPLTSNLSAFFAVAGRFFRTPLGTVDAETPLAAGDSLTLIFEAPNALPFGDGTREMTRVMRFELGLSLGLGRVVARPTDRSGSTGSTTAPRR